MYDMYYIYDIQYMIMIKAFCECAIRNPHDYG